MVSRVKIKSIFLAILLFMVLILTKSWAVSPNEATVVGTQFIAHAIKLQGGWGKTKEAYIVDCKELKREGLLLGYHLSIYPHGHIVVSVLKQLPPVKSFSTTCDFDTESEEGYGGLLKDTMQATLLFLQQKYGTLKQERLPEAISPPGNREAWKWLLSSGAPPDESTIVGPLLQTTWGQLSPFNNYCPMGDGGRSVAGCVAISAAQVMKYWNYPSSGTGSHSYWWGGDGSIPGQTLSATFSDPYDWENVLDSYSAGYNDAQAAAVAELCYEVGVAFEMDYGYWSSASWTSMGQTVFPRYFKYDPSITVEYRGDYGSADAWFERIKEELNATPPRPMTYRIADTNFAHAVVCDGYYENGVDYIHINYGWTGSYDNWYALDNLYCGGPCNYLREYALCGIQPGLVLEVDPSSLDFGKVDKSSTKTMTFRAYNTGGGTLSGNVSANRDWIKVSPTSFEGNDNIISVTVETEGLAESHTPYAGIVTVISNGGNKTIEVSVIVIPGGVVAYPNPYSLSVHTSLTFWGSSVPHAKIQIFTLGGELIRTLEEEYGASTVSWDGRNERGDKVGPGIYFCVVDGFVIKFAVIE